MLFIEKKQLRISIKFSILLIQTNEYGITNFIIITKFISLRKEIKNVVEWKFICAGQV